MRLGPILSRDRFITLDGQHHRDNLTRVGMVVYMAPWRLPERDHRSVRNVTEYRNSATGGM
jgi:hypothetical protein